MERSEGTQPITAKEAQERSARALREARQVRVELESLSRYAEYIIDQLVFNNVKHAG